MIASSKILLTKRTIGGVLDVVAAEGLRARLVVAACDLEILEIEIVIGQVRHGGVRLIHCFADGQLKLVVLDHDELDTHRGLESNLVQSMQIGRIGDGQEEALTALHQRQYAVLRKKLFAHRTNRVHIKCHRIQVQQWHTKLVRGGNGDIAGRGQIGGDQMGDQTEALLLRLGNGILHGRFVQQAILDQALRKAAQGRPAGAANCRYCVIIHGLNVNPTPLLPAYYR